jgi:hypothetical protein
MIAHVSIGVRDIDRSKRFYDAALEPLGYKCLRAARTLLSYGYGRARPMPERSCSATLWSIKYEPAAVSIQNGSLRSLLKRYRANSALVRRVSLSKQS